VVVSKLSLEEPQAPALESRDLKVQCFDSGLLELEFALQALQERAQVLQRLARGLWQRSRWCWCIAGGGVWAFEHGSNLPRVIPRVRTREAGLVPHGQTQNWQGQIDRSERVHLASQSKLDLPIKSP
jgi:hypothetical protein